MMTSTHLSADELPKRRQAIVRRTLVLILAIGALAVYILFLGDMRRKGAAMSRAEEYAALLSARPATEPALPLDLEAVAQSAEKPLRFRFDWLSREEALRLRESQQPIIVAQTQPLFFDIAPDGRAVILFDHGAFRAKWLSLATFDETYAKQKTEVLRLSGDAAARP